MKRILFLSLMFFTIGYLAASPVDMETAKKAAKKFMSNVRPYATNEIQSAVAESLDNVVVYYVVNFVEGGWVMISANNATIPILGYSDKGTYATNDEKSPAFIDWTNNYKEQIKKVAATDSVSNEIMSKWNTLLGENKMQSITTYTPGSNLLNVPGRGEVMWGQDYNNSGGTACSPSYNQYMPTNNSCRCGHEEVGCGAVAMGQIMWYWRWPHNNNYMWWLMPAELTNSSSHEQAMAVAGLLQDCADAADMSYINCNSWTTVNAVVDAFKNSFQYKGVDKMVRSDWPSSVWKQMIRNEIDCGRPVLYRGDACNNCSDLFDKHMWVIDGYDYYDHDYFHMNFGWNGQYSGFYFSLDLITSPDLQVDFNVNQRAIIGISPTCTEIPMPTETDITDVDYTTVDGEKAERARNSISLPGNGKTLTVNSGGHLSLGAGNSISLKPGFSVGAGGKAEMFIAHFGSGCSSDCGIQLMYIDNAIIKGRTDYYGYLEMRVMNANSYDMVIFDRANHIIFQGVGRLTSNVTTNIWDGTGADFEAVYRAEITIRNNCGEKIVLSKSITVLLGGSSKKAVIDSNNVANLHFTENSQIQTTIQNNIVTSNGFIIFPNPNDGHFTIGTDTKNLPYSISVINIVGQIIYKETDIHVANHKIKLPEQSSGFLVAEIIANKKKYYTKIITE